MCNIIMYGLSLLLDTLPVLAMWPGLGRRLLRGDGPVVAGLLQLGVQPHHLHGLQQGLQGRVRQDLLEEVKKGGRTMLCLSAVEML